MRRPSRSTALAKQRPSAAQGASIGRVAQGSVPRCVIAKTKSPVVYRAYRCSLSLVRVSLGAGKAGGCERSRSRERAEHSHSTSAYTTAHRAYAQRFRSRFGSRFGNVQRKALIVSSRLVRIVYSIRLGIAPTYRIRAVELALFAISARRNKQHHTHQGWVTGLACGFKSASFWVGFK
jgi:hypothetical protein